MRVFLIIWSVYLLGLSLAPCSDTLNGCEPVEESTPYENHNHSNDADDSCTPFCHCACCSISLTVYNFNSLTVNEPLTIIIPHTEPFWTYSESHSSYFGSIWQPPKINS